VIDANFSTLWCEDESWTAELVFAVLNSTWGEVCMEALGATLGGGALKLEATHLRQLPVPTFSVSEKENLRILAREMLDSASSLSAFRNYRNKVDRVVISALRRRKIGASETSATAEKLAEVSQSLRAKRRCLHSSGIVWQG
jgi:hypothetical protein